jgi:hypothetical protein
MPCESSTVRLLEHTLTSYRIIASVQETDTKRRLISSISGEGQLILTSIVVDPDPNAPPGDRVSKVRNQQEVKGAQDLIREIC